MESLDHTLTVLDKLAHPRLAGSWDNVGLLLQGHRKISSALLTIDLTEAVCAEAVATDVDLVIAYHPPIFRGLKAFTEATPLGRSLLTLARLGIHVYSPHTALDAVSGGLNDWLLEAFGDLADVGPIEPDDIDPSAGPGRLATLVKPQSLGSLLPTLKTFLGVPTLRVAGDPHREVRRLAVCPGAGGAVFEKVRDVDLLLTGEMRHHDVLAWVGRGTAVILAEHTHTERGFLPRYGEWIRARLDVDVRISDRDADPLVSV